MYCSYYATFMIMECNYSESGLILYDLSSVLIYTQEHSEMTLYVYHYMPHSTTVQGGYNATKLTFFLICLIVSQSALASFMNVYDLLLLGGTYDRLHVLLHTLISNNIPISTMYCHLHNIIELLDE